MFLPKLEIRHLRMLQAMAQTASVTRAASLLGLTQSALSHQIREAERRLGVPLFTRSAKRLQLTQAARILSEEASQILSQIERAEANVGGAGTNGQHTVRIGCGAYSCYRWLPPFLRDFQAAAADIDIEVVADATQQPLKALLDRRIDVAVTSGKPDRTPAKSLRLFRDELTFIMPPGHPLAQKRFVVAQDLVDQTYISYSNVAEKGHEYDAFLRPAQVMYKKLLKVELTEAIVELVRSGFGVSILSHWAVAPYLKSGALVAAKVTAKGLFVDWYAVTRKSEASDSPACRLAAALKRWCQTDQGAFTLESGAAASQDARKPVR